MQNDKLSPDLLSDKLSPGTKFLLLFPPEDTRLPVSILFRLSGPLDESKKKQLEEVGCRIRSVAGEIISADLPLDSLIKLSELEFVLYVEVSHKLFPEKETGG